VTRVLEIFHNTQGATVKHADPRNSANFPKKTDSYHIKFYTIITKLYICRYVEFWCKTATTSNHKDSVSVSRTNNHRTYEL